MSVTRNNGMSATAFAGATVANVGCGFDILGFALQSPGDEVTAELSSQPGVVIKGIEGDNQRLPLNPQKNTAGVSVLKFLEHIGAKEGVALFLRKKMPLGSGLGSSAASAAAALFAVNHLFGSPLTTRELVPFAMEGERVACGSAHADNVAPSLLGGIVLIRSYSPLDLVEIPVPAGLHAAICHPHLEVNTADARQILRKEVSLRDAVKQWGNIAGLIAGFYRNDLQLVGRSLEDFIIEPARSDLIPGFAKVKESAIKGRALGCSISGSGPSMFALCANQQDAEKVSRLMAEAFDSLQIGSDIFVSAVGENTAPKIL